jgi:hypothetical protein
MDKIGEFKEFLSKELEAYSKSIVFNRNPVSIEYYTSEFYSKIVNEFVRLEGLPQTYIDPKIPAKEFMKVARDLRTLAKPYRRRLRKEKPPRKEYKKPGPKPNLNPIPKLKKLPVL